MKFLIAGYGSIGRRHFQNLLTLGEKDVLFYRTHQSTLPDEDLRGFHVENDLEAALAHKPQAVIISNPTSLHLDVAIPAAQSGCHLFLEKPISHTTKGLDDLLGTVIAGSVQVLVGYQFRFHPGLRHIKRLLDANAIGKVLSTRAHWGEYLPNWHPWEDYRKGYSARSELGGGVILTLSHPIDYLRWLLGEVSEVWAFTGRQSDLGLNVEDTAEIGLRFKQGTIGSIHLDYNQRPATHHLEIIGAEGTIRWDNETGEARIARATPDRSADWESHLPPEGFERNDLFLAQMQHFLQVVRGSEQPECTLDDGIHALRISLAALQSQTQGELIRI